MIFKFENKIEKAKFNYVIAIMAINMMIDEDEFWDGIPNDKIFTHTEHSASKLKHEMKSFLKHDQVSISFYRSSWFYRNVVANVNKNNPRVINFNTRHYSFGILPSEDIFHDVTDKINTIIHEASHVLDNILSNMSFGHGDNNSSFKSNSFPYWIGKYAQDYFMINFSREEMNQIFKRINYVQ